MSHVDKPHFAFPFQRGVDGRVNAVEQDDAAHIMSCENVIVRCPLGFRLERPEFGWPWPEFQNAPLDLATLEDALRRFEPRSNATGEEYADAADAATRGITIRVEV